MTAKKATVTVPNEPTAAGIRVGGYLVSAGFILEGVDAFHLWESQTPNQVKWAMTAISITLSVVTNIVEKVRGRKLLGAPPA